MTVDAAVGSRAILGRGIEHAAGIPQGDLHYLNFINASFGRNAKENDSTSITGFGGKDRASPGPIDHEGKLKYDLTTFRVLIDLVAMYGAPASVDDLGPGGPWLVKIRPGAATPTFRGIWNYLHEGGSYSGVFQFGRRVSDLTLADTANKRVEVDATYTEPTGDTIAGVPVADAGNTGTLDLKQIASRGRRAIDGDFTAGKSVYVLVDSITGSNQVTLVAKVDDAGFTGVAAYGANTFDVFTPDAVGHDGYSIVKDSTSELLLGNFNENFEPFEITLGDQDLTTLVVGDEFEFPVALYPPLTKVVVAEHRISEFHKIVTVNGIDTRIDSGSTKWMRPYKPYYSNGRKLPSNIDPTGDIEATITFKKRLFDRYFRQLQDAGTRFQVEDVYKFGQPLDPITPTRFEGIHLFYPQMATATLKSGDIPNKNTLEENVTLEAEQPDATPTPPAAILDATDVFDADSQFPMQANILTPIDPSFLLS
jgi:hypothetical protein